MVGLCARRTQQTVKHCRVTGEQQEEGYLLVLPDAKHGSRFPTYVFGQEEKFQYLLFYYKIQINHFWVFSFIPREYTGHE